MNSCLQRCCQRKWADDMTARDFLNQLKKLDKLIENKQAEKKQWMSLALSVTAHLGDERVQASGSQQKMADAIDKCVDIDAEISRCIEELIEARQSVIDVIERLPAVQYDVLHKVYVQYYTFYDVADTYNMSYNWVKGTHKKALKAVQQLLDEEKCPQ